MTAKEKLELLKNTNAMNSNEITDNLETGLYEEQAGRCVVRMDIRTYIKERTKEEGLTSYQIGEFLGKGRANYYNFLRGLIPFPLTDIEQILWILDGKITTEQDDLPTTTRIIKTTRYE